MKLGLRLPLTHPIHLIEENILVKGFCISLIAMTLSACGGSYAAKKIQEQTIGTMSSATIASNKTGAVYTLSIYLPPSYSVGSETYPVIYATDGDAGFPPAGRFLNFAQILQHRNIDAILIGIGGTSRRSSDYTLPGARAYHAFLAEELIPFIESHFRADSSRRILSGVSLGGSFVVSSLFLEATKSPLFSCYISTEGSFFQPTFAAQEKAFTAVIGDKSIPITLILARGAPNRTRQQNSSVPGTKDTLAFSNLARNLTSEATNHTEVDAFYHRMMNRHYPDMTIVETTFETDHIGTDNPAFEDAIKRIFK